MEKKKNNFSTHTQKIKEETQGLEQSKTIISLGNKQDLLGAMPVLLVFLFFPFLQPVCFDKQRTVPQTLQGKKRDSDVQKKNHPKKTKTNIGSQRSTIFLAKPDCVKNLKLLSLSSGFRYTFAYGSGVPQAAVHKCCGGIPCTHAPGTWSTAIL